MSNGEIILYTTEDGRTSIQLRAEEGSVWLTQAEIAELFQTTPQNVTGHLRVIYAENELDRAATCKESLQVRSWQKHGDDGKYDTAAKILDEVRDMITESWAREIS